jgi:hypothetical protein
MQDKLEDHGLPLVQLKEQRRDLEALSALEESAASEDTKTRVLREFYADRARQFSE